MNELRRDQACDTRQSAERLNACPPPRLRIVDLQRRWHCSQSTVSRLGKTHDLQCDGPADAHPVFDLLVILGAEEIADPLAAWALGSDDERRILAAPLLSIEDLQLLDRTVGGYHPETFRRRARAGKREGFKLGNRWLLRATIDDLIQLDALRKCTKDAK